MFNVGDITFIVIVTLIIIIEFDSARTDNQITTIKLSYHLFPMVRLGNQPNHG